MKAEFLQMLHRNKIAFADSNEALLYNTAVVATIPTTDDDVVYSKLYPYPRGVEYFVASDFSDLSKNGIIIKSKSAYNNPV